MIARVLWDINHAVFWICIAIFIVGAFGRVRVDRGAKELSNHRVRFGANWFGIALLGVLLTMVPSTVRMFLEWHFGHGSIVAPVGITIGVLVFLLELPGTILVSDKGLEQRFWFGKNKRIRWSDIVEIESERKGGSVTIKSSNRARVVHSSFHSGRLRFLEELKLHCGNELPADFPGEPLENA